MKNAFTHWLRLRWRGLFQRGAQETELNREMRLHLDMLIEENLAAGMNHEDARNAAMKEFGGTDQYREECRDSWRPALVSGILRDLRFATRSLRRSPGFTITAGITLALGIGACTTMFSVIHSVLLNRLPVRDQDRLVFFWENNPGLGLDRFATSPANLLDYRAEAKSFSDLIGVSFSSVSLSSSVGPPTQVSAVGISAGFSNFFGWPLVLGRDFLPEEDVPGGANVVVLDEHTWRERYNADPGVLGRTIYIDRSPYKIVGVVESGSEVLGKADLWRPLAPNPTLLPRGDRRINVIGRLTGNVTLDQAQAEMNTLAANLRTTYPEAMKGWGVFLEPLYDVLIPPRLSNALGALFAAVGLLLLIACANVANLLLSRALARDHEIAVRAALGASQGQLVRQLLCETTVLAFGGAILGTAFAAAAIELLRNFAPSSLPRASEIALDGTGLLFAGAACALTVLIAGLMPAFHGSRAQTANALGSAAKTGGFSRGKSRLRSTLVVTQFALALSLVVGAGLLLSSFDRLQKVDPGYDPEGVLSFQITPNRQAYEEPAARLSLYERIREQLRVLPGVTGVAMSSGLPFGGNATSNPVRTLDPSTLPTGESIFASWRIVDPTFFDVMQINLVEGRTFTDHDDSFQNAVIIISRGLARRLWPDESAIGKRIYPTPSDTPYTVVGVVEDIALTDLTGTNEQPQIYYPVTLWSFWDSMSFAVRSQVPPETLTASVRRVLLEIDPEQPVYQFDTLANLTNQNLRNPQMNSWLLAVFAGLALLLAAVGIYAVMHTMVTQRTREIGVRMALGAQRSAVLSLMLRRGAGLVFFGLGIGVVLAWRFSILLENQLFETEPTDVKVYVTAAAIISAAGMVATLIPARRATKVDPIIALRAE